MRHRVVGKKLGRDCAHRRALLRNLSDSLLLHGGVTTTLAKAKYVQPYVERLITMAKKDASFVSINRSRSKLFTDAAARNLFEDIAPRFSKRAGGYTRIVKLGNRLGDGAAMARLEFVVSKKPLKKVAQAASKPKESSSDAS